MCLLLARAAEAGPYMTGIGLTNLDLFPNGLFPEFSGPLQVGGAYGQRLGGSASSGGVLRIGIGLIKFDDVDTLAEPSGMVAFESLVHFEDSTYVTMGLNVQRGFGPIMVGGSAGFAIRGADESGNSDLAIVLGPELSVPLRWRARPRFTPAAVLFARLDVAASRRDAFGDKAIAGLWFAMW